MSLEIFNDFFDDVMNGQISIHAFGMYAKGLILNLEAENAKLKEPKGYNSCNHLADNVCNHPGIPEFYTPQYINYSGCGLLESKAP